MAQYLLCIKYFVHKWNPNLTDQIKKKVEYNSHTDLLFGWKWVSGRLRILLFRMLWLFPNVLLMDFTLAFSPASLTSASEENYMAQGLCILLFLQPYYFFLKCMQIARGIQLCMKQPSKSSAPNAPRSAANSRNCRTNWRKRQPGSQTTEWKHSAFSFCKLVLLWKVLLLPNCSDQESSNDILPELFGYYLPRNDRY